MALAELLAALEREAEARLAGELATATAEAAAIAGTARARLEQRRVEELAHAMARHRAEAEQQWSHASRAAERSVLASREALLERVLTRVRQRLSDPQPLGEADAALTAMVMDAMAYAGSEPVEIRAAPGLCERITRAVGTRPGLTVRPDPTVGAGSIVTTQDGRLTVDASLAGRLTALEAEARILILQQFGGGS
jgi:vacuolar-type H+-ATPase subunit E/Vma4